MLDEVKGFGVTLRRMVKPKVVQEYPEVKRAMMPRFRGLPSLRADPDTGEALCVACGLCARICPTSCLEMHVVPSEEGDRELGEFILKAGRCMFCGLCSQVCPVDAITMSQEYELSVLERDGLIYTKTELASIGAQAPIWWDSGVGPENQQTNARTATTGSAITRPNSTDRDALVPVSEYARSATWLPSGRYPFRRCR